MYQADNGRIQTSRMFSYRDSIAKTSEADCSNSVCRNSSFREKPCGSLGTFQRNKLNPSNFGAEAKIYGTKLSFESHPEYQFGRITKPQEKAAAPSSNEWLLRRLLSAAEYRQALSIQATGLHKVQHVVFNLIQLKISHSSRNWYQSRFGPRKNGLPVRLSPRLRNKAVSRVSALADRFPR